VKAQAPRQVFPHSTIIATKSDVSAKEFVRYKKKYNFFLTEFFSSLKKKPVYHECGWRGGSTVSLSLGYPTLCL
jgi:hypothetical protein